MKTSTTLKGLTFGDLVVSMYDECGKAKAPIILKRAVNSHCVKFCGKHRLVID